MKKHFEIILLDVLWLSATILFANFWFDIRFGFNIFYGAHWHYLAVQQLTHGTILPLFYISIALFVALGVSGLYLISRPRLRKIDFSADAPQLQPQPPESTPDAAPDATWQPATHDPKHSSFPPAAPILPSHPELSIQCIHLQKRRIPSPAPSAPVLETQNTDAKLAEIF